MDRRNFLKYAGLTTLYTSATFHSSFRPAGSATAIGSKNTTVCLVKGTSRFENLMNVLEELGPGIKEQIGEKQVVIKPNFVSTTKQLAGTHVDALRATLEFLKPFYKKKIIIAESAGGGTAMDGYKNFGHLSLADTYNVEFRDLNQDDPYPVYILDKNKHPLKIMISKLLVSPDTYLISSAILKTHNCVVATLSTKNIAMGAPLITDKHYKGLVHQGTKEINYNLFRIAQVVRPHLALIDGFEAMEGNGPVGGTPVPAKIALGSTDMIAADRVAVECMGIDYKKIGYLQFCAAANLGQDDLSKIDVKGERIENCIQKFRLHDNIEEQYLWQ